MLRFLKKILFRHSALLLAAVVFLLGVFAISYRVQKKGNAQKERQIAELEQQIADAERDNERVRYLLTDADPIEMYEQFAREQGYVYPDEIVYVDVTPGA